MYILKKIYIIDFRLSKTSSIMFLMFLILFTSIYIVVDLYYGLNQSLSFVFFFLETDFFLYKCICFSFYHVTMHTYIFEARNTFRWKFFYSIFSHVILFRVSFNYICEVLTVSSHDAHIFKY